MWPPVLVANGVMPENGFEAREGLIGTVNRTDGTVQLTYNGWPLYFDAEDNDNADINGHLANEFGGQWRLIGPNGDPILIDPELAPQVLPAAETPAP